MSLHTKFVLLIGVLALAVVGSIVAAAWSFGLLRRELSIPFASTAAVMEELGHIKRDVEEQARILLSKGEEGTGAAGARGVRLPVERPPARGATPAEVEAYGAHAAAIRDRLGALERNDWRRVQVGVATWRNLVSRIEESDRRARRWIDGGDEGARWEAGNALFQIHELIEKTELQILASANLSVRYGEVTQSRLLLWLGSVSLTAVLTSVLGIVLLRRWVQRPVEALRVAAGRIAVGDFGHRVPVESADEMGQLSAEVNHMAQMVQEMQEERVERERLAAMGSMVRRLVHNVRNPLSGIRGLAEVTRLDTPEKSEARENLDMIISTVDTFGRWLNELLESTSPEKIAPEECGVKAWIEAVVEAHRPMAQAKGVKLVVDTGAAPATAVFDRAHLDHALAAIISNAIEATPAEETVRVEVAQDRGGKEWEVRVWDAGPGVDESLRERIFEPHFTTKRHGTGIGLAVARQVARAHAGRIEVENGRAPVGNARGACFRIRLPYSVRQTESGKEVENGRVGG